MTAPPPSRPGGLRPLLWLLGLGVAALIALAAVRPLARAAGGLVSPAGRTEVTQSLVVERVRAVARLVTSETAIRDVVVYRNTRLGSTKRALVVVTGRVLAGIDLDAGTEVRVDHAERRVRITLPRADVMGVEVTEMQTYDERSGLWNPFRPADRDVVFRLARERLTKAAREIGVARHAEESAERLLGALVSADGYATEVTFADKPKPRPVED